MIDNIDIQKTIETGIVSLTYLSFAIGLVGNFFTKGLLGLFTTAFSILFVLLVVFLPVGLLVRFLGG